MRDSVWGFPIIDFHCHFPVPDEATPASGLPEATQAKLRADWRWYQEQWWDAYGFPYPEEVEPPAEVQAERWDAEIDAARRGRSFDRRTCVALALAMTQEATDRDRKRSEATKAGIPLSVAGQIERYALRMRTTLQQPILPQTISPSQGKRA